jgi:hypothetical protein
MEAPQNHIWGPPLWMILHSAAERIGLRVLQRLPQEEIRIWTNLLSSLRYSLPCPLCKKHYTDYFGSHPIHSITKEEIRNWLYHLHSHVNQQTGKQSNMSLEEAVELYSQPFQYSKYYKVVENQMILAVRLGRCARVDLQRTVRCMEEMKRFYEFF